VVFAVDGLRETDAELVLCKSIKSSFGCGVSLMLTSMKLLDRLSALIPPSRWHQHWRSRRNRRA